ncbi:MAG TPA: Holliday junction branch migration DNA helicase RuvB [Chloroflexota bacterium]|jgi:Holliday junction DNA helicase RuvB|nr:Holliday junction branch migration DNA helicase RuvB [Chloroflexota bacterium]
MAQNRLVSPQGSPEDEGYQALRPARLAAFVGQDALKERLAIAIHAARERGEYLEHVLFHGPPGLGKTTLAHIIAAEMGGKLVTTSGPALEKTADLMGILTNLEAGDVLFVDEIHRTPRAIEEYLYPAMEDFAVDFVLDKGPYAKAIRLTLKPFTLVGATTRAGLISGPLRDRFGLYFHLDFYSPEALASIVARSASILGVDITPEATMEIARRARGTPRIANRLLRRVRDFAQYHGAPRIDSAVAHAALLKEGVDELGLDELDRKVLTALITRYGGGPVGIEALAATIQEEVDTLEEVVEPYLLYENFLIRTATGRKATPKAYQHLGLRPPAPPAQPALPLE